MSLEFFSQQAWRWKCNMSEAQWDINTAPSLSNIREEVINIDFDNYCNNRMVQGYFRYGGLKNIDKVSSYIPALKQKLSLYEEKENIEYLFDIRNFAMLECVKQTRLGKTFKSIDDKDHYR